MAVKTSVNDAAAETRTRSPEAPPPPPPQAASSKTAARRRPALGLTGAPICLLEESPHPDARGPRVPGPPLSHVQISLVVHDVVSVEDTRRRPDRDARLGLGDLHPRAVGIPRLLVAGPPQGLPELAVMHHPVTGIEDPGRRPDGDAVGGLGDLHPGAVGIPRFLVAGPPQRLPHLAVMGHPVA